MTKDTDKLIAHYSATWGGAHEKRRWNRGPTNELGADFGIVRFEPTESRKMWTFATHGMTAPSGAPGLELHIVTRIASDALVELLTVTAHFHRTGRALDLYHTVNFGRPWSPGSKCDHGFITLPLLDGPALEICDDPPKRCLWLVPVTAAEVAYKKIHGAGALEDAFEAGAVDYLDPARASCL